MKRSAFAPSREPRNRWRRVGENAFAMAGARGVSALTQLLVVSILLQALGLTTLGWILAVMAPVALSQFADFGVSLAMQQAISEASAHHDAEVARRTFDSGRHLLGWIALGWGAVCLPVAWWGGHLIVRPPTEATHPELIWLVATLSACASLYTSAGTRLAAGMQMSWESTLWTTAVNGATVIVLGAMVRMGTTDPVFIASVLGIGQFLPGWLTGRSIAAKIGWSGAAQGSSAEMRRLWQAGLPLAGAGVTGAIVHAITPIVVAASSGLASSAAFSILQRFFGPALQGHALLQSPFWPEYTHAVNSGHGDWVKPAMKASLAITAIACATVATAAFLLPWIMPLWLGTAAPVIPFALVAWVAGATIAGIVTQPFTYLLLGLGRLQHCSGKIAAAHCCTIALIALLGWSEGALGVAAALTLGATFGVLPFLLLETRAALGTIHPATSSRSPGR